MDSFTSYIKASKLWQGKIHESLVINNLKMKGKPDDAIKVLNRYRGNIVIINLLETFAPYDFMIINLQYIINL